MTTDTVHKEVAVEIEIGGKTVTIGGMCTVSYTHLDVYKRQGETVPEGGICAVFLPALSSVHRNRKA